MQGDLSIKQRDRLGGRQPEPREDLFGLALQLRFNTGPDHFGLGHSFSSSHPAIALHVGCLARPRHAHLVQARQQPEEVALHADVSHAS